MDIFTIGFWIVGIILLIASFIKDKDGTKQAGKKSSKMIGNMVIDIIGIILLIGLVLELIPPEQIEKWLGSGNVLLSSFVAAIAGSITLIPAFVAFPLVSSLVSAGASIIPGVAFLTTLTMVGVVTFPLEQKEFGTKFAMTRNAFSFVAAIVIAGLMGVIL